MPAVCFASSAIWLVEHSLATVVTVSYSDLISIDFLSHIWLFVLFIHFFLTAESIRNCKG